MLRSVRKLSGFTLVELLVVMAIIAILIGLLLPGVQKAREAGARADNANDIKQLVLATHTYVGARNRFPVYDYGDYPTTSGEGMYLGNGMFVLLPYIEQDNVVKATYGPITYSSKSTSTYNGVTTVNESSSTYTYSGYQGSRAKGIIKTFVASTDPTLNGVEAPVSYLMNSGIYWDNMRMERITDGLSNTLAMTEGYSKCISSSYTDYGTQYPTSYAPGSYYKSSSGYTREWNHDRNTYNSTSVTTSKTDNSVTPRLYQYDYSSTSKTHPSFSGSGWLNPATNTYVPFQVRPAPDAARSSIPQATTSGGLTVGYCDGSVRTLSSGISQDTFRAMHSYNGGETIADN